MDTASEMLREAGWNEFTVGGPPSGGFVTGAQPQLDLFCRDDAMLNVMGNAIDDTTYVRLSVTPIFGASPCDELTGHNVDVSAQLREFRELAEDLVAQLESIGQFLANPERSAGRPVESTGRKDGGETQREVGAPGARGLTAAGSVRPESQASPIRGIGYCVLFGWAGLRNASRCSLGAMSRKGGFI